MVSNAPIAGVGPDAFSEKKDPRNNLETGSSTDIEPAPVYVPDEAEKDGSEEINYHTLTWWYVYPITHNMTLKLTLSQASRSGHDC